MEARGFTPAEVWVPNWSDPQFQARLRREADVIAEADSKDADIDE